MYLNIFNKFEEIILQPSPLTAEPIFSFLTPSNQVCFSQTNGNQLGACTRQIWFEKNNFTKTNLNEFKNTHVEMSKFIGSVWEDWLVDLFKQSGYFVSKQVPSNYSKHFVKGFCDILIKNPLTNNLELVEVKTYDGSNYYNNNIYGTSTTTPKPKITHLLQAFRYLLIHKEKVDAINLVYVDRSCSAWFKNKQFRITLQVFENNYYPYIEVMWGDTLYAYIDKEITEQGILKAEEYLITSLKNKKEPPSPDYISSYTPSEIESKYQQGLIYKTSYNKYKENSSYIIGDFQCTYCPYNNGTCQKYE